MSEKIGQKRRAGSETRDKKLSKNGCEGTRLRPCLEERPEGKAGRIRGTSGGWDKKWRGSLA